MARGQSNLEAVGKMTVSDKFSVQRASVLPTDGIFVLLGN
jgi:hypothetical protein